MTDTHTAIVNHGFIQVKSFHKRVLELVKITIKRKVIMPSPEMIDALERSQNRSNNSSSSMSANNTSKSSNDGQKPTTIERVGEAVAKAVTFAPAVAISIVDEHKAEQFWEKSGEVGKKIAKTAENVAKSPVGKMALGATAAIGGSAATVKWANELKKEVKEN